MQHQAALADLCTPECVCTRVPFGWVSVCHWYSAVANPWAGEWSYSSMGQWPASSVLLGLQVLIRSD